MRLAIIIILLSGLLLSDTFPAFISEVGYNESVYSKIIKVVIESDSIYVINKVEFLSIDKGDSTYVLKTIYKVKSGKIVFDRTVQGEIIPAYMQPESYKFGKK